MPKLLGILLMIKLYAQKYFYQKYIYISQKLKPLEKDISFQTWFDAVLVVTYWQQMLGY